MRIRKLPGSTIEANVSYDGADKILTPMFYSGGLVLSQVAQLTGLEGYIIQNWIKRKYIMPPFNKKYSRNQLCRIFIINTLKHCFTLDQIITILNYVNNSAKGEPQYAGGFADDGLLINEAVISDSDLYIYFINVLTSLRTEDNDGLRTNNLDDAIAGATSEYAQSSKHARNRLADVLKIMIAAYASYEIKENAVESYAKLDFI